MLMTTYMLRYGAHLSSSSVLQEMMMVCCDCEKVVQERKLPHTQAI